MRALVTGGNGFLGRAIVERLLARGDTVRSFSRSESAHLKALQVEQVSGDLDDTEAVLRAVEGSDVVFHVAAKAGIWGPRGLYHRTNVLGTQNVLVACGLHRVRRLIYTSTPSVVFNGEPLEGVDESQPYAERFETPYAETKATAEAMVLTAASPQLATVALRPHLIWGPGDPHLLPRLYAKARAGQLRRVVGDPARVDCTYIDNAAEAHLLAADRLSADSRLNGRAYFISQGEPLPMFELLDRLLAAADLPPIRRTTTVQRMRLAGWILEGVYTALGLTAEPPMTRFLARQLTTSHWFDISAARRDLGYGPSISLAEGLSRLREASQPRERVVS